MKQCYNACLMTHIEINMLFNGTSIVGSYLLYCIHNNIESVYICYCNETYLVV